MYLTNLSFILFTFVLVGGFAILLLLALLLALVAVAAPLPPEPDPRTLLAARLPPGRLLPPPAASSPHHSLLVLRGQRIWTLTTHLSLVFLLYLLISGRVHVKFDTM